jgi:hypothetical protein
MILRARPSLEALEERWLPSAVTYHNGPLIDHVKVEALYVDGDWSSSAAGSLLGMMSQLNHYLGSLTNSPYMDQLREYSEPGYTIGRGQFLGSRQLPVPLSLGKINDQDIQTAITNLGETPDPNRLYMVFTPPNVHVQNTTENSYTANGFRGYHWTFPGPAGSPVRYAVIVDQKGNYPANGISPLTRRLYSEMEQFTWVASHELAEVVTDPDCATGWFGAGTSQEIGDLCNGYLDVLTLDGTSYVVQKEWSNLSGGALLRQADNTVAFALDAARNFYEETTGGTLWHRNRTGDWNVLASGHDWQMVGTGDFDHSGNIDLLWRQTSTGQVWIWQMSGTQYVGSVLVTTSPPGTDWLIVGTGDFDHSGNTDLLWRQTSTGQVWIWRLQGTQLASSNAFVKITDSPPGTDWQIVGTGDFDKDGNTDILWRQTSTGQVWIWRLEGTGLASSGAFVQITTSPPGTGWQIRGVNDFDQDGNLDLVWQQHSTGQVWLWRLQGTQLAPSNPFVQLTAEQAYSALPIL